MSMCVELKMKCACADYFRVITNYFRVIPTILGLLLPLGNARVFLRYFWGDFGYFWALFWVFLGCF